MAKSSLVFSLHARSFKLWLLPAASAAPLFEVQPGGFPCVEAAEQRSGIFDSFVLEEGRHTGARVLGGSSAVGNDEFIFRQLRDARSPIVFGD
jgi:hypothetical protein